MAQDPLNLIWIDLEMTGLDPVNDYIIEIATVITDSSLNILDEGPVMAIHQSDETMNSMDEWNTTQHGKTGLIKRVKNSSVTEAEAEKATIEFLMQYVTKNKSPMCGNSICQDRRFLARLMPELNNYFHYRHIDVSTLKELAQRWAPGICKGFSKESTHIALNDIKDSINELKYYREKFINVSV